MTKQEFITKLQEKLYGLPKRDIEESLNFYIEMIEDRIEEGLSEEEAVLKVGTVDEIASQIIGDISILKIAKERIKPKRSFRVWEIILIAVGSPIWVSLAIATVAVIFSLYVVLWSVIVAFWAVYGAFITCAVAGILGGLLFVFSGNAISGIALILASIFCAGLAIFTFFGCKLSTNGNLWFTKKLTLSIKKSFIKKENA